MKETNEFKAMATNGYTCIEISEESELIRYNDSSVKRIRWQTIKFDAKGEPFFTMNGRKTLIDNFMRI